MVGWSDGRRGGSVIVGGYDGERMDDGKVYIAIAAH